MNQAAIDNKRLMIRLFLPISQITVYLAFIHSPYTFSGELSAVGHTFSGELSAVGHTFSGELSFSIQVPFLHLDDIKPFRAAKAGIIFVLAASQ